MNSLFPFSSREELSIAPGELSSSRKSFCSADYSAGYRAVAPSQQPDTGSEGQSMRPVSMQQSYELTTSSSNTMRYLAGALLITLFMNHRWEVLIKKPTRQECKSTQLYLPTNNLL